jgi:hypothetical protein
MKLKVVGEPSSYKTTKFPKSDKTYVTRTVTLQTIYEEQGVIQEKPYHFKVGKTLRLNLNEIGVKELNIIHQIEPLLVLGKIIDVDIFEYYGKWCVSLYGKFEVDHPVKE